MPECHENLMNIYVFMRFPFSVFSVIWACKLRLWDLILEDLEGPGLPYRPPCYAMLWTAEIHDFQVPPRIPGKQILEGDSRGLAALYQQFTDCRSAISNQQSADLLTADLQLGISVGTEI